MNAPPGDRPFDGDREPSEMVDAVVIGGGPAGLSAALWLGRHRRLTVLVDSGEPRNRAVDASFGYLGFDGVRPSELLGRARSDLGRYPTVSIRPAVAGRISPSDEGFLVQCDDGELVARRVVLATGVVDVLPPVAGLGDHYGADVFVCPSCDGYESQGARTAVVGWGPHVLPFAVALRDWASSVTVVTHGQGLDVPPDDEARLHAHGIVVEHSPAVAFLGTRGALRSLTLADGQEIECTRAFVSVEHRPVTGLAEQLGCRLDEHGYVEVDGDGATSVRGVFAAGDLTPGPQLIQVAAAEGAAAGVACAVSLRGRGPVEEGAPVPGPRPRDVLGR